MTEPPIVATSAAVPSALERGLVEQPLAALDIRTARHMAGRIARFWTLLDRVGRLGVLLPVGACSAVTQTSPDWAGVAMALAFFVVCFGAVAGAIGDSIATRALKEEMNELGFDAAAGKAVAKAFRASRKSMFVWTRAAKQRVALRHLETARGKR